VEASSSGAISWGPSSQRHGGTHSNTADTSQPSPHTRWICI
jgi:hypothetical protein